MSLGMVVFAGAVVAGGTGAFFSDTETSTGNVFTAGAIDLKVDSVGHVNGLVCFNGSWTDEDIIEWIPENGDTPGHLAQKPQTNIEEANADYNTANPANVPKAGDECGSTWALTDLKDGVHKFFNFTDVKPGDEGEDTISLHVDNNDAWMCVDVNITKNDDVSSTEPELEAGDVLEDGTNNLDGELAQNLTFFAWADDGDNIWEKGEPKLFSNTSGPASDVLGGKTYTLADSSTGTPIPGATTRYIGLAWCAGTIDASVEGVIKCDGGTMGNIAQTDTLEANIAFRVEQARNNEKFLCNPRQVPETGSITVDKVVAYSDVDITVAVSDFQLTIDGPGDPKVVIDEVTEAGLEPGEYIVSEAYTGSVPGLLYNTTFSGSCVEIGDTNTATMNLNADDNLTCTVTNTITGHGV